MSTALRISLSEQQRLGPRDHGQELSFEEFVDRKYENGFKYELIEGRLYVSPQPNFPHDWVQSHVYELLSQYKLQHRQIVKRLSANARVFVPGRKKTTCPEPDFAIYRECPPGRNVKWHEISPLIVVEIVSASDSAKDYVRNVELYRQVPSILEYWLFDRCDEDDGPLLKVYRRETGDADWTILEFLANDVYETSLLPGFALPVTPLY